MGIGYIARKCKKGLNDSLKIKKPEGSLEMKRVENSLEITKKIIGAQ